MPKSNIRQQVMLGAVTAGILGTLSAFLYFNSKKEILPRHNNTLINQKNMIGGVAGGLIGVATALLFAPTSGTQLLKGVAHPWSYFLNKNRKLAKKIRVKTKSNQHSVAKKKVQRHQVEQTSRKKIGAGNNSHKKVKPKSVEQSS